MPEQALGDSGLKGQTQVKRSGRANSELSTTATRRDGPPKFDLDL